MWQGPKTEVEGNVVIPYIRGISEIRRITARYRVRTVFHPQNTISKLIVKSAGDSRNENIQIF